MMGHSGGRRRMLAWGAALAVLAAWPAANARAIGRTGSVDPGGDRGGNRRSSRARLPQLTPLRWCCATCLSRWPRTRVRRSS